MVQRLGIVRDRLKNLILTDPDKVKRDALLVDLDKKLDDFRNSTSIDFSNFDVDFKVVESQLEVFIISIELQKKAKLKTDAEALKVRIAKIKSDRFRKPLEVDVDQIIAGATDDSISFEGLNNRLIALEADVNQIDTSGPAGSTPDAEDTPEVKKHGVIDISERALMKVIGVDRMKDIIERTFLRPLAAGKEPEMSLEITNLFITGLSGEAKIVLEKNLERSGYTLSEFQDAWKDNLAEKFFERAKEWAEKEQRKAVITEIGAVTRKLYNWKHTWRNKLATFLPMICKSAVMIGAYSITFLSTPLSAPARAARAAIFAAAGGAGGYGVARVTESAWMKKQIKEMDALSMQATDELMEENKEKLSVVVRRHMLEASTTMPVASFLSQSLRESSFEDISDKLDMTDVNAYMVKQSLGRQMQSEEATERQRLYSNLEPKGTLSPERVVESQRQLEIEKIQKEQLLDKYLKQLNDVNDEQRKILANVLANNPGLKERMFKAIGIDPKKLSEAGESVVDEGRRNRIIIGTVTGASMGALMGAFPELRIVLLTYAGAKMGMALGEKRDRVVAEEKFVEVVRGRIDEAEEIVREYDKAPRNVKRGSEEYLKRLSTELRIPLTMGLLEDNIGLLMRSKNVLRRVDTMRYEVEGGKRNVKMDDLLAKMKGDVDALEAGQKKTEEDLGKRSGWRRAAGLAVGGVVGVFVGEYLTERYMDKHDANLAKSMEADYGKGIGVMHKQVEVPVVESSSSSSGGGSAEVTGGGLTPEQIAGMDPTDRADELQTKFGFNVTVRQGEGITSPMLRDIDKNPGHLDAYSGKIPALEKYMDSKFGGDTSKLNVFDNGKPTPEARQIAKFIYDHEFGKNGDLRVDEAGKLAVVFEDGKYKLVSLDNETVEEHLEVRTFTGHKPSALDAKEDVKDMILIDAKANDGAIANSFVSRGYLDKLSGEAFKEFNKIRGTLAGLALVRDINQKLLFDLYGIDRQIGIDSYIGGNHLPTGETQDYPALLRYNEAVERMDKLTDDLVAKGYPVSNYQGGDAIKYMHSVPEGTKIIQAYLEKLTNTDLESKSVLSKFTGELVEDDKSTITDVLTGKGGGEVPAQAVEIPTVEVDSSILGQIFKRLEVYEDIFKNINLDSADDEIRVLHSSLMQKIADYRVGGTSALDSLMKDVGGDVSKIDAGISKVLDSERGMETFLQPVSEENPFFVGEEGGRFFKYLGYGDVERIYSLPESDGRIFKMFDSRLFMYSGGDLVGEVHLVDDLILLPKLSK